MVSVLAIAGARRRKAKSSTSTDQSESMVMKDVSSYLIRTKLEFNRINNGSFKLNSESSRKSRMFRCNSKSGKSDIEIFTYMQNKEGTRLQIQIWIELKTKTGKQSEGQVDFSCMIDSLGGLYFLVTDTNDLISALKESRNYIRAIAPGYDLYTGRISIP